MVRAWFWLVSIILSNLATPKFYNWQQWNGQHIWWQRYMNLIYLTAAWQRYMNLIYLTAACFTCHQPAVSSQPLTRTYVKAYLLTKSMEEFLWKKVWRMSTHTHTQIKREKNRETKKRMWQKTNRIMSKSKVKKRRKKLESNDGPEIPDGKTTSTPWGLWKSVW